MTNLRTGLFFEGSRFPSVSSVARAAKSKGATVSLWTMAKRIKNGAATWQELLEPEKRNANGGKERLAKHREKEKANMHAICEEMDARKKAMGLDP